MDVFSNLMIAGECLLDKRRTLAFKKAIHQTVKKGDIVMDVGTGSGILAMLSAMAGAKHVHAIEIATDVAQFAQANFTSNKLDTKITLHNNDIVEMNVKIVPDVITMELLDTGLVAEHQALAINHLHSLGMITPSTKLIPYRYQAAFELVDYDFDFYGVSMPFIIQARNFGVRSRIRSRLTTKKVYLDLDFHETIQTHVNATTDIKVAKSGKMNALVMYSKTYLSPKVSVWGTADMNMPVVIPIKPRVLTEGQVVSVNLNYIMSEGFSRFQASVT